MKYGWMLLPVILWSTGLRAQGDEDTMRKFFRHSLSEGQAYADLDYLCRHFSHRLSGSPGLSAAITWAGERLRNAGADTVYLQPVMVPHWERGEGETVRVISARYGSVDLSCTSIGNTIGTGPKGLNAQVVEVGSREQLEELGKQGALKSRIVFLNVPMERTHLNTGSAYGQSAWTRSQGAGMVESYGATGLLVRSLAIDIDDHPHTGAVSSRSPVPGIPAMTISTLAADELQRMLREDPGLKIYMENHCRMLPPALSHNLIAEIRGSTMPDEVMLIGAHLDSWDLGAGAHDDGAGVVQVIEVLRMFRKFGHTPRHSLRVVLFTNEENGLRGGIEYAALVRNKEEAHVFALESDSGGFAPRGFTVQASQEVLHQLQSWLPLFRPWRIHYIEAGGGGADISPLGPLGVPLIGFDPEDHRYFNYHHAGTDTFDKVDRRELEMGAAAIASLVYLIDRYGLPGGSMITR
jgi:carboxypeptidase Q